jgi:formamidopyrimidine-DNA glycosylase
MPELPEVETVRRGLEQYVVGKKVVSAESFHQRTIKPSSLGRLEMVTGSRSWQLSGGVSFFGLN